MNYIKWLHMISHNKKPRIRPASGLRIHQRSWSGNPWLVASGYWTQYITKAGFHMNEKTFFGFLLLKYSV